jgi:hypothetical protein
MSKKICYLLVMRWALGMTELIEQPSGDGRGQLRPIGQRDDGECHNTPPISSKTLTATVQNRQTIAHDPATHWKCRIPAREDFELALELLAFGITTSDRIRDRLRRKKQLILQKVTGKWNSLLSDKFVNEHAWESDDLVLRGVIRNTGVDKTYVLIR